MKWVFDVYSNVYKTAMMQDEKFGHHAATAKDRADDKRSTLFGLFARR